MDLEAVIVEIGATLDTITGLRVVNVGEAVVPPAAFVTYPEEIIFDLTYLRGKDAITLQAVVVVGKISARATRAALAGYCNGSGASSVKAVLDDHAYTSCEDVTVKRVEFDVVTIAAVDYVAAIFDLEVIGAGA